MENSNNNSSVKKFDITTMWQEREKEEKDKINFSVAEQIFKQVISEAENAEELYDALKSDRLRKYHSQLSLKKALSDILANKALALKTTEECCSLSGQDALNAVLLTLKKFAAFSAATAISKKDVLQHISLSLGQEVNNWHYLIYNIGKNKIKCSNDKYYLVVV